MGPRFLFACRAVLARQLFVDERVAAKNGMQCSRDVAAS